MPSLLNMNELVGILRDLAHLGYHANGNLSVAAADAIDNLLEEIRVVRANHAQLLKDFDARNEVIDGLELKLQEASTKVTQLEALVDLYAGMINDAIESACEEK